MSTCMQEKLVMQSSHHQVFLLCWHFVIAICDHTQLGDSTIAVHLRSFSGKMRSIQSWRPKCPRLHARPVMRSAGPDAVIRSGYSIPSDTGYHQATRDYRAPIQWWRLFYVRWPQPIIKARLRCAYLSAILVHNEICRPWCRTFAFEIS